MKIKLNEVSHTDVIVIQALTRDISKMPVNEINDKIGEIVSKALAKAKKIVISTIVQRDDDKQLKAKAELVNAYIKYTYAENSNVIICDNFNLRDEKFREQDGIHLTPHGTSVLATNLKHKVAEALGIEVMKKPRGICRHNDRDRRFFGEYRC